MIVGAEQETYEGEPSRLKQVNSTPPHATAAFAFSLSTRHRIFGGAGRFLAENCEFEEDFRESSVALFHKYLEESGDSNDRESGSTGR